MQYAGFWPRLAAAVIDFCVLAPLLIFVGIWSVGSRTTFLWVGVPLGAVSAFYHIYSVGRWGQTVGKIALKIQVVALDGTAAGYARAFYRHSVDVVFTVGSTALTVLALASISSGQFDALPPAGKAELMAAHTPAWGPIVDKLLNAWIASEFVVLLCNEKRRALHDFIAGTVVVHKRPSVLISRSPSTLAEVPADP